MIRCVLVEKHKLDWTHFYDDRGMMANRFEIEACPTYIVMDHESIVYFRHWGWNSQLDAQIDD